MSESELKACPFCGGEVTLHHDNDAWINVICQNCFDEGIMLLAPPDKKQWIIDYWNTRPREQKLEAEVERLKNSVGAGYEYGRYMRQALQAKQRQLTIAQRHRDTYREIVRHLKKRVAEGADCNHQAMGSIEHLEVENQRLKERFAEMGLRATVAEDENRRLREGVKALGGGDNGN